MGPSTVLADRYEDGRLNSPNDVVVKSDGAIYFTDPPYGIEPHEREQPHNGVYRVLPDGRLDLVVDDFERPNGLAFSPDESVLYIDDSAHRHVRAFDVRADGTLANSRILADMDHPQPGFPGRDEGRHRKVTSTSRGHRCMGVRAGWRALGRGRAARAAGQLRLGRRRPEDALHHGLQFALSGARQGAGNWRVERAQKAFLLERLSTKTR